MPFHIFWSGSFAVQYGDHFRSGIICGSIWGSFAVRDHLRFNLGIICGPGSFAVLGSFADPYSTRTDTFVYKFSNLSALVTMTFLRRTGILLGSRSYDDAYEDAFYQVKELIAPVDGSFGITWFLINSLKMLARKLISRKACRPTRSENS